MNNISVFLEFQEELVWFLCLIIGKVEVFEYIIIVDVVEFVISVVVMFVDVVVVVKVVGVDFDCIFKL